MRLQGIVKSIVQGDQHAETEVVVQIGSVNVIVTKKRKPYHHEADFTRLGLDPRKTDIVVVKLGYLVPELYDMRADWIMALTPRGRRSGSGTSDVQAYSPPDVSVRQGHARP